MKAKSNQKYGRRVSSGQSHRASVPSRNESAGQDAMKLWATAAQRAPMQAVAFKHTPGFGELMRTTIDSMKMPVKVSSEIKAAWLGRGGVAATRTEATGAMAMSMKGCLCQGRIWARAGGEAGGLGIWSTQVSSASSSASKDVRKRRSAQLRAESAGRMSRWVSFAWNPAEGTLEDCMHGHATYCKLSGTGSCLGIPKAPGYMLRLCEPARHAGASFDRNRKGPRTSTQALKPRGPGVQQPRGDLPANACDQLTAPCIRQRYGQ
ncbi:hypothetical protein CC80DRAFT_530693 [Byssothecium circinans]|uniref:Uncharacterized protein n=1 Tax=Byssothecium circinans TaxID=147558 RepID=A0A6A5UNW9_9PLEO|nr:hypothetical protein CC80DRAFT_530693 [Byssothecium circinans]